VDGFDNAIASLEKVVWMPEQIELNHMGGSSVERDTEGDQQTTAMQF
jgi:hypothetical protein